MSANGWPMVPLGEVAKPVVRRIAVVPGQTYRTLGVKWWGEGAYERDTIDGVQTAAKQLFEVHENDLIINKIWVRHGSISIVPREMHGCVGSNEFPTFVFDSERVLPRWIHWISKTRNMWNKCAALSQGTSGKNRIKPEKFLTITMPLPSLSEQRRIVAKIEQLAQRIDEADELKGRSATQTATLVRNIIDCAYREAQKQFGTVFLEEACQSITDGAHLTPTFTDHGIPFIFVGNVSSGRFHLNGCKYVSQEYYDSIKATRKPEQGDILYSAVGATLGVPAIVDCSRPFCFQRHVAIIKPSRDKVSSEFLCKMLGSGIVYHKAWESITGTAQPTIPLRGLRALSIPLPPLPEQRRIVAYLDDLQAKVNSLKERQSQSSAELEALLPSILDRAFKGEL